MVSNQQSDLARMRLEYGSRPLERDAVADDPFDQFDRWLSEAVEAELAEPNAMVVSTVDADGHPRARHLLLKGVSVDAWGENGFEFYTNYSSAKGRDLAANPACSLTFGWLGLHRQVVIAGTATRLSDDESDAYFSVRPRGSQLGAWASNQSEVIAGRETLTAALAAAEQRFAQGAVPRPPHWGGYRVTPRTVEFWQGHENRLHDRLRYRRDGVNWVVERLSP